MIKKKLNKFVDEILLRKKKNKKIYTHKVVLKSRVEINLKNERRL